MTEYLTEKKLREFAKEYFKPYEFQFDRSIKETNCRYRPDIYIPDEKVAIEFDGYQHYTTASRIIQDSLKDDIYLKHGIRVIRIPYFVQLSPEIIDHFFSTFLEPSKAQYVNVYPHGFIDPKAVLPADFCSLGIVKFKEDLKRLPKLVSLEIVRSLTKRTDDLHNRNLVFPHDITAAILIDLL